MGIPSVIVTRGSIRGQLWATVAAFVGMFAVPGPVISSESCGRTSHGALMHLPACVEPEFVTARSVGLLTPLVTLANGVVSELPAEGAVNSRIWLGSCATNTYW